MSLKLPSPPPLQKKKIKKMFTNFPNIFLRFWGFLGWFSYKNFSEKKNVY